MYVSCNCELLNKPPYVCTGCPKQKSCKKEHAYYTATKAHADYLSEWKEARSGIRTSKEDLIRINDIIAPLIMRGQSINHILVNHKDEITNPNAQFMPLDYPLRNGHNNIFVSEEAQIATNELDERLKAPLAEYKVKSYWDLPEEVQAEYFKDVDRDVTSQVNKELFDEVDRFYSGIEIRRDGSQDSGK